MTIVGNGGQGGMGGQAGMDMHRGEAVTVMVTSETEASHVAVGEEIGDGVGVAEAVAEDVEGGVASFGVGEGDGVDVAVDVGEDVGVGVWVPVGVGVAVGDGVGEGAGVPVGVAVDDVVGENEMVKVGVGLEQAGLPQHRQVMRTAPETPRPGSPPPPYGCSAAGADGCGTEYVPSRKTASAANESRMKEEPPPSSSKTCNPSLHIFRHCFSHAYSITDLFTYSNM